MSTSEWRYKMSKKMLIDATHEEETRVAVLEDGRLEGI